MSVTVPEFWKLVIESRLLTREQCQLLGTEFGRVTGAGEQDSSSVLAKWLISRNALTQYQAAILEAGRSGPFHYGDYKVYDRLQQGPFAGSFRAIHEPTSHPTVLKFVAGAAVQDAAKWSAIVARVQAEAKIIHPNLNRIYEPVDLGSYKFIAMEDVPGESLGLRVASSGPLQWSDACRAARSVALAMAALHASGKIHGDVRPQNIWLDPGNSFRLLRDPLFEPRALHDDPTDAAGQLLQRSDYLAPELAQPGKTVDPLTDIYALGCTLYFLLSGRPPFPGGDVMQKLQRHATEPIQSLEQFGVPPQIGQLVTYLMAKNPAVRYQQMAVVAEQITPYVDSSQLDTQPIQPPQTLPAYESWIKRKQSTLAATTAAQPAAFPVMGAKTAAPGVAAKLAATSHSSPVAVGPQVNVQTTPTSVMSTRFGATSSNKNTIIKIAGLSAVAVLAIVLLIVFSLPDDTEVAEGQPDVQAKVEKSDAQPKGPKLVNASTGGDPSFTEKGDDPRTEPTAVIQTIVDDDELPWATPTAGPPIDFNYVPQSTGIYFIARPADIVSDPEGAKTLRALGPQFAAAQKDLETKSGFAFEQMDQIVVGIHESDGPLPRPSFRITLLDAVSESDLLGRWSQPQVVPVPETDSNYYKVGEGLAYFIPPHDAEIGVHQFLLGSETEVERVAKGEVIPLLHRDLLHLLEEWSDAQRHLTVLFAPAALLDETGQKLFADERTKLRDPLDWFLPREHIQAGMLSLHFGSSFFAELRMKSNLNKDAYELARDVQGRLAEIPDQVFDYITTLGSNPYWERLRFKYPNMISELYRQSRIGTERTNKGVATAVVNCYLPAQAASNLVVGAELAIASQPGVVLAVGPPKKQLPKDIDDLMQQTLDVIDIPQNDLVLAVQDVKDAVIAEFGSLPFAFDIKLMGNHLMANGITKNQKVTNFHRENATYADILTGICMTANTITTVKDPSEADQKLIWVIAPESPGGDRIVLITTRDAAAQNDYPLPQPFQPKSG